MKSEIIAHCPKCEGSGKLELEGPLLECAQVLKKLGTATLPEIHEAAGEPGRDVTVSHQRIRRLIKMGAVKKVGYGRPMRFQLV